jgi:hypothetical protein
MRFAFIGLFVLSIGAAAYGLLLLRSSGGDMVTSGQQLLSLLDSSQRERATRSFDNLDRLKWHFIPLPERKGLQIKDMDAAQRKAAFNLLQAGLSEIGYYKARQIMSLEYILRELEKTRSSGPIRDPERYYFTIYGTPDAAGKWGWSAEGHHLSLNFTVENGKVISYTPSFLGSNPATVVGQDIASAPGKGTRVLGREEDLGFELLAALDADQRKTAVIAAKAPKDVHGGGEAQPTKLPDEGLPAVKLKPAQSRLLRTLLETYCGNMAPDIGSARMAEIEQAGFDKVYFAWAGADHPGVGHYYRVQGPTFVLEFCNTQPDSAGNPANHVHTLWRDTRGDFGLHR